MSFWRLFLTFALLFAWPFQPAANEPAGRKTILMVGDSITAGYGVDEEEAFPALIQQKIDAAGLNYRVINAGLSGDTSAGGFRRINWLLRQRVDVLLLELGGNDGLRGIMPEETKKNLLGIVARTKEKYPDVKVIIAGMQMADNMGEEYTRRYKEIFPEVAQAHRAVLIPFILEGVGGKAELNQPDRIHPTAEGHKIIAETVWKYLQPVLSPSRTATAGR